MHSHATVAAADVSPAIQDYLKASYRLEQEGNGPFSLARLAAALDVAPPSVTNMVKRLQSLKFVRRDGDGKLSLTPRGMSIALEVIRHHRLLETFLVNELGMDWAAAHREAEVLEHYISERMETLLDQRLAKPTHDPHGEPIPRKDGTLPIRRERALLAVPLGTRVRIAQVHTQEPALLEYLQAHALIPGAVITVERVEPFNGPVVISVGKRTHHIGREVAACIVGVTLV